MSITLTVNALQSCNLDTPETTRRWLAVREALNADAASLAQVEDTHTAAENLTVDNLDEVLDRLTRQRVDEAYRTVIVGRMRDEVDARAMTSIRAEADRLVTAARKAFDKAARQIVADADKYQPTDSTEAVLLRGPDVAAAWGRIQDASAILDRHLALWSALYGTVQSVDAAVKSYDTDHWRRVDAEALFAGENRWHALVAAGYGLRLNTLPEMLALIAATPERTLRAEATRENGFYSTQMVRS